MADAQAKPLFLLVNDDGVHAPGLAALAETVSTIGDVVVCAPLREQSGQSQAITIYAPLRMHELGNNRYAVEGTPADCVMLALQQLLPRKPDWVISGINHGGNLGTDIMYSGTVGAALEGCIGGCKAMAVSLEGVKSRPHNYATAARVVKLFLEHEDDLPLGPNELLNINVPNFPFEKILGIRTAKIGRRFYEGKMWERHDPRGNKYFWIGGHDFGHDDIPGSDCVILNEGYATVSVLQPNLFHKEATERFDGFLRRVSTKSTFNDLPVRSDQR